MSYGKFFVRQGKIFVCSLAVIVIVGGVVVVVVDVGFFSGEKRGHFLSKGKRK